MILYPYPPDTDWEVEELATAELLETRINELRVAGTGVKYMLGNVVAGYTILYLRPSYNFQSNPILQSVINDITISV